MKSPELEHFQEIFEFFGKTSPYKKIFKIMFRKFTSRHQSMLLCAKFVKIVRQEIGKIVHYSCDQKNEQNFGSLSSCCYCEDRAQSLPWPAPTFGSQRSKFHPNWFTFGEVIAGHVKAIKTRLKVFPTLGEAIASRRVIIIIFSTGPGEAIFTCTTLC